MTIRFEFNCADCGQPWSFAVRRKEPNYCQSCAERRRKLGMGPTQMRRRGEDPSDFVLDISTDRNSSSLKEAGSNSAESRGPAGDSANKSFTWSDWHQLDCEGLKGDVPDVPGVYEIRIQRTFDRLIGNTQVVNIGVAKKSLRVRVRSEKACNPDRYLPGPLKWLKYAGVSFEVRWFSVASGEQASMAEAQRLAEFISAHFELPPGNRNGAGRFGTDLSVLELLDPNRQGYIDFSESSDDFTQG